MSSEEVTEMIRRMTEAVDAILDAALRTQAAVGVVLALDEASMGLHRARIALVDSAEAP